MSEITREMLIESIHEIVPDYIGEHFFDSWSIESIALYLKNLKKECKDEGHNTIS